MYRILPKQLVFVGFAWLVLGTLAFANLVQTFGLGVKWSGVPALAWLVLNGLLWNPIWRWIWRKVPALNKWFPDLNGEWDVELCSNWARQVQVLDAAAGNGKAIDMRLCLETELAPLTPVKLRAEITQTWWSFEMAMWNPEGTTPIDRSDTISVDPIRRKGLRPAGICYFFKQRNVTGNVSDDNEFYGAARLTYDPKTDKLSGLTWTARMWQRAMNTGGPIVFTRVVD